MALLHDQMRQSYRAQRGVSQGAQITLVAGSGCFTARFECAQKCKEILGSRYMVYDCFTIPFEHAQKMLAKLIEVFSVALVDLVTDEQGSRFVLLWKIPAIGSLQLKPGAPVPELAISNPSQVIPTVNLDEY